MAQISSRLLICSFTLLSFTASVEAHHPDRECQTVRPRVDVIGPLGNNLRPSYRREMNRPRFLLGKLAYVVAPTTQEAMAWHKAEHQGAYANESCRIEPHYFYPKPWEALKVGPRRSNPSATADGLQPIANDAMIPLQPNRYGETQNSSDSMALSDGEDDGNGDSIIDSPGSRDDSDNLLPEPPSSPSDIVPETEPVMPGKPSQTDARDAIGSGLQKVKERLKINSPR